MRRALPAFPAADRTPPNTRITDERRAEIAAWREAAQAVVDTVQDGDTFGTADTERLLTPGSRVSLRLPDGFLLGAVEEDGTVTVRANTFRPEEDGS